MFVRDRIKELATEAAGREDWDHMISAGFFAEDGDGFRHLEALGDDLSLADAPLLDLDDLLNA